MDNGNVHIWGMDKPCYLQDKKTMDTTSLIKPIVLCLSVYCVEGNLGEYFRVSQQASDFVEIFSW